MIQISELTLLDLASARLWIALRDLRAVEMFYPVWNISTLPVQAELIREPDPDAALISAMRTGAKIGVYGIPDGGDRPEQLLAYAWPYAVMSPDAFNGNIGRIGAWRGVTVVAQDLRKVFPLGDAPVARAAMRAKIELVAAAMAAEAGNGPVPIGADWKAGAPDVYGISDFCAFKTWKEVAKDYPLLSNPKGKPKKRRSA